ncbi:MAG TPA: TauD/TfdA family dioxygenase [Trebonia sp.]|jgi:hypothetical protein
MGETKALLETKALSPHLGVRVLEVGNLLDDAVIAQCLEALKWRGVLLVRGANLDDDQQLAFSRRIGEVVSHKDTSISTISLDPDVNPLAEILKGTFNWHLDGTYDKTPQKATTLTAKVVAMTGGQTEFASTYAAYENLPPTRRSAPTGSRSCTPSRRPSAASSTTRARSSWLPGGGCPRTRSPSSGSATTAAGPAAGHQPLPAPEVGHRLVPLLPELHAPVLGARLVPHLRLLADRPAQPHLRDVAVLRARSHGGGGVLTEFPLCDQELLLRALHNASRTYVKEYTDGLAQ